MDFDRTSKHFQKSTPTTSSWIIHSSSSRRSWEIHHQFVGNAISKLLQQLQTTSYHKSRNSCLR